MVYPILLGAGLVGLIVMALVGMIHATPHVSHARSPVGGHAGARAAHAPLAARTRDPRGAIATTTAGSSGRFMRWLVLLLSPLNWCAWLVGAGAAGTVAHSLGAPPGWTAVVAALGAIAFHRALVKPLLGIIFRFASPPASNLEGCIMQRVEAVTSFNARGEGLVRITIDGHSEDIFAKLIHAANAPSDRVQRGDALVVEDVDPKTSTCTVSRA
jgi:hypothetical protein